MSTSVNRKHMWIFLLLFAFCITHPSLSLVLAQEKKPEDSYILPPESVQDIFSRDKNFATLDNMSPDKNHFLIPLSTELSSLKRMATPTYRLAQLEFCPDVNREWRLNSYGIYGLRIYSLKDKVFKDIQLPDDIFVSDMMWSPDGNQIAFLAHLKEGTQVWIINLSENEAKPLCQAYVMATLTARPQFGRSASAPSRLLQWTADGSVLALLVPSDRGPEPKKNSIPQSPIIRHTREKPTSTPTYPFLLRTPHDKKLFSYYTTAQLALLTPGKPPKNIGQPAMYMNISLSPDGKYILAEKMVEPFSYITSYRGFPRQLQIINLEGKVMSTIRKIPLQEAASTIPDSGLEKDLPREVAWRPDGKGLIFLWREKKKEDEETGENKDDSERKDRFMTLSAPFDISKVQILVSSEKNFSQVSISKEGRFAFATLTDVKGKKRHQKIMAYDLTKKKIRSYALAKNIDPDDLVNLPGKIVTRATNNGTVYAHLSNDKKSAFLQGPGYKEDFKPQPFIDRVVISNSKKQRIFEGSKEMLEQPLVPLDNDMTQIIISQESPTVFPDSYLWSKEGSLAKLTENKDPFPEITACKRIDFECERRDGLTIHGRISLPVNYKKGTRVPAMFWTYPSEYTSEEEYKKSLIRGQRGRKYNGFSHLSYLRWSDIWLTQGYAMVHPDIPIIGKDNLYNENCIAHLVDSMYAAIRKVDEMGYIDIDRIGHGGHSYGAFATANYLAHTPFFKAGIAGDGAYNRTLTPMTFQYEKRFLWEAQNTYLEMSPFFYADHIDTPLLMYHGAQDNNTGTFLIQSERFMQVLTGLGKKAALYIYPFESHGPSCVESYLDLWARWLEWFDKYVKGNKD